MNQKKIKSFTDLTAWQKAHKLAIEVYKATDLFPESEKFVLVSQIRRSVISITSNIAEGFSRQGIKEKIQFYYLALGSTTELQNQLLLARDLKYLENKKFQELAQQTIEVHKLINGLIKSLKKA